MSTGLPISSYNSMSKARIKSVWGKILAAWELFDIVAVESAGNIPKSATDEAACRHGVIDPDVSFPNIITVGAIDRNDQLARFSYQGAPGDMIKPDITAPGVGICIDGEVEPFCKSGTSLAAPDSSGCDRCHRLNGIEQSKSIRSANPTNSDRNSSYRRSKTSHVGLWS